MIVTKLVVFFLYCHITLVYWLMKEWTFDWRFSCIYLASKQEKYRFFFCNFFTFNKCETYKKKISKVKFVTCKQHLLPFALLALFLGAGHEDHIVDLAKGPNQVCNFLLWCIHWDACQINQAICKRRALGGGSRDFLLLLGWWRLGRLETNSFRLVFGKIQFYSTGGKTADFTSLFKYWAASSTSRWKCVWA